jgi:transcriptional regulator GlxA family with amidase domain
LNIGILIFENVELLDFAGPYEVFSNANLFISNAEKLNVFSFSFADRPIKTINGLSVLADYNSQNMPSPNVLIIPGGEGTKDYLKNTEAIQYLQNICKNAELIMSVCSGARVLAGMSLLNNKKFTTHHLVMDELVGLVKNGSPQPDSRYIHDGNIITAAGVSAGIDASLYLVEHLLGKDVAEKTAKYIEYPYSYSTENNT